MLYRNAFSHGVPAYHHAPHIRFPQTHDTIFVNRYTCYFNPHEYTFQFSFYLFVSVLSGPAKDIRLYNTKYCWLPSTGGYADIFNLVYGRFYPAVAAPGSVYTAAPCALCIFVEKKAHMHICTSFYRNTLPNRYGLPLSRSQSLRPSLDYYIRF